jgi:hypothetical protein
MNNTIKLEIGSLTDPISKQLAGCISAADGKILDRDADSITYVYVRGYMPDATVQRARKKLIARCQAAVTKHTADSVPSVPPPSASV